MKIEVRELLGKTLTSAEVRDDGESIVFTTTDGEQYKMRHRQDCCENVYIESIAGDLSDLVGEPLLRAEEKISYDDPPPYDCGSYTWTFYTFATRKGYCDIRWFGTSNGYYSEGVDLVKLTEGV